MMISRGDSTPPPDKRPPVPPATSRPPATPPKIAPHDDPAPPPVADEASAPKPDRRALFAAAGVLAVALIAVTIGALREPAPAEAVAPATPAEPAPPPPPPPEPPKTAEEWVARARISGVRATRIIADGNIYGINQPIPPFQVRWTGKTPTELIFVDAAGVEIRRPYARSFNSDPTVAPPATAGETATEP